MTDVTKYIHILTYFSFKEQVCLFNIHVLMTKLFYALFDFQKRDLDALHFLARMEEPVSRQTTTTADSAVNVLRLTVGRCAKVSHMYEKLRIT